MDVILGVQLLYQIVAAEIIGPDLHILSRIPDPYMAEEGAKAGSLPA